MRRVLPFVLASNLVAAASSMSPVAAQETDADYDVDDDHEEEIVHPIVFPVIGEVSYTDTFGAPRDSGRSHEGQDLLADKMQQLVAADDGVVTQLTWPEASYGYYIKLTADDGWTYSYVHINNDTPGTDDGAAERSDVYGPGVEVGARVERGQLLGYLGDSGNAEHTVPHLHFEMHTPDGEIINPMASLDAAQRAEAPAEELEPSPIPRLAGEDRVATAIEVSRRGWSEGAPVAVLAAGESYAEALPASVLASKEGGPLLLVTGDELLPAVEAELDRLEAVRVVVVGSVAPAIDGALRATGRSVQRVGTSEDAVATAAEVATEIGGDAGVAVLVNRSRFADGVSASAIAAAHGWPILLTDADLIPQRSVDVWRALGVTRLVLVGGTGVIGANIERFVRDRGRCASADGCEAERLAGTDRYGTSVAAARRAIAAGGTSVATMLLGTGANYPDTLASGPLVARLAGVALLIDGTGAGNDDASRSFLTEQAGAVDAVAILGGSGAVTSAVDRAIQEALGLA